MSSTSSSPTEMRTRSGVTPDAACCSSVSCWCVVLPGWMISVLASPMLARCEISRNSSMNLAPVSWPPLTPNVKTAPAPRGRYRAARSR